MNSNYCIRLLNIIAFIRLYRSKRLLWQCWLRSLLKLIIIGTLIGTNSVFAGEILWLHEFGSVNGGVAGGNDSANSVTVSPSGIYIAGYVFGSLLGEPQIGWSDAFIRKFDTNGNLLWSQQFGTPEPDSAEVIINDGTNLYIAGWFGNDEFVQKIDSNGVELWTRRFSNPISFTSERPVAIAVDRNGVYIAGITEVGLNGQGLDPQDFHNAFIRKYDLNGNELWTRQFGTSDYDVAYAINVNAAGVYVSGLTRGTFSGQYQSGNGDVFLQKFDLDGNPLWARQFGTTGHDEGYGLANDASGVYIVGNSSGPLPGQTGTGGTNGFIRRYDHTGNEVWTTQISAQVVSLKSIANTPYGYAVSGTVYGELAGQVNSGGYDSFVQVYDTDGNLQWTKVFGTTSWEETGGVATGQDGIYLAGSTFGSFAGEANLGPNGKSDAYIAKISPLFSSLVGDKDDFQPGNPVDVAPKSSRAQSILNYITTDPGQNPPANLDEGGTTWFTDTNRPVGLTHFFTLPPGARVSGATIHLRAKGAAEVWNDAIIYDQSFSPSESDPTCFIIPATCNRQAYSPMIVLRDLLGHEPRESEIMELNIDLSKVPVRTQTQSVPGGHWFAKPDQYRNLLNMLYSGQFNMVLADDSALDYSELSITYAPAGALDGELNGDGLINRDDLNIIMTALNTLSYGQLDPRDLNHDGRITVLDGRMLVLKCNNPNCAK